MLARTTVSALTTLLLLGASPVWAQAIESQEEAQAFAERLKAVAAEQGIPISYDSATIEGANVTLTGFRFDTGTPGAEGGEPSKPIDVTFQEVSGSTEEGFLVETIPFEDIDSTSAEGARAVLSGMSITGLQIAGTSPSEPVADVLKYAPLYFDGAGIESITVEEGGKQVFSLSGTNIENSIADNGAFSSSFNLGTFDADLTTAPADEPSAKTIRDIGYDRLSGSISGEANWDPATGVLSLDPFSIDVNDAGSLSFTYAISGYTPQFMESMKQMQQQMAANPSDTSASGMAIMGLVSQLYLDQVVLSYEDASLTNKLLDYFAQQNGQPREAFVEGLTQMVPQMLAALNNAEFQTTVSNAVSTFLRDPKSLRIAVEPANPIPATQIIGAAMGAPQTLPSVLQVSVTANEAGGAN